MRVLRKITELTQIDRTASLGFVPTMGYLHEGHLSLIKRAKTENETVLLSIFVNPLQFGPKEDFARYPRDMERDLAMAREAKVDYLFIPEAAEIYPKAIISKVEVPKLTTRLCGASRQNHFSGVATVLAILFNLIRPTKAYFGLKDAQQVAVVTQMVQDLHFPLEVVPCETVRESDGLAISSRNIFLTSLQRKQAQVLSRSLFEVERNILTGKMRDVAQVSQYLRDRINDVSEAAIDYVEVLSYPALDKVNNFLPGKYLIALAVLFGQTRLIDNTIVQMR